MGELSGPSGRAGRQRGTRASASGGFTPADIAHAARTVSQAQFERTFYTGTRATPTTDDYLDTIRDTKPTVSAAMAQEFAQQTEEFARI